MKRRNSVKVSKVSFIHILPKSKLSLSSRSSRECKIRHDSFHEEDEEVNNVAIAEELNDTLSPSASELDLKSTKEYENVAECYKEALEVVYLPISSQFIKSTAESFDDYAYIGLKLVQTIRSAFPNLCSQFEAVWNMFQMEAFPADSRDQAIDHALYNLTLRRYMTEEGKYDYYSRENFVSEKEYQQWKRFELENVDAMIDRANSVRNQEFLLRLKLDSMNVMLHQAKKDQKQEIFYKVKASGQPEVLLVSKYAKYSRKNNAFVMDGIDSAIDMIRSDQDLVIHLYRRNLMNSERFGEVRIPIKDLLPHILPSGCAWGVQPFESTYPIRSSSKSDRQQDTSTLLGSAYIDVIFQMERYRDVDRSLLESMVRRNRKITNFHGLFDILVHHFIKSNLEQMEKERYKQEAPKVLDYNQQWIIQEYCNQHGISEVYKRLSIMRQMVQYSELLLLCIDEFKDSIDFVHSNIQQKIIITTKFEMRLLETVKKELNVKLTAVISKFMSALQKRKRKVLRLLIELLDYVLTSDGSMTKKEFSAHLSTYIAKAVHMHYNDVKAQVLDHMDIEELNPPSLSMLAELLTNKIGEIFSFSVHIPAHCKYETTAAKIFTDRLREDFEKTIGSKPFTGFQMLQFCHKLQLFNDEMHCNFSKKELQKAQITLFDAEALGKGSEEKYLKELRDIIMGQMHRSVELDQWQRINDEVLHSSSVVDIFTAATQTLDFIHQLDFLQESLLEGFAKVVGEVVVAYAKILQELCLKDIISMVEPEVASSAANDSDMRPNRFVLNLRQFSPIPVSGHSEEPVESEVVSITTDFVVKLNDIEAARAQYREIIQAFSTDPNASKDDVVVRSSDADESSSDSDSDSDTETDSQNINSPLYLQNTLAALAVIAHDLDTLIAGQLRPFAKNGLLHVIQGVKFKRSDAKLPDTEIVRMYGELAVKIFREHFLESILSPNLATLSENIYEVGFSNILAQVFSVILHECANLINPFQSLVTKQKCNLSKQQIAIIKYVIQDCEEYFYGDGEGLPRAVMAREKRYINQIIQLAEMDTARLISLYSRFVTLQDTSQYSFKGYHILAVLSQRSNVDKEAKYFLRDHQQQAIELYLLEEFCIHNPSSTAQSSIIMVHSCHNNRLKKGKYYILNNYILWSPSLSLIKRKDSRFSKDVSAIDRYSGKIKIRLSDIAQIEPRNGLVRKRVLLHLNSMPNNPIEFNFRRSKKRDRFLNAVVDQCKVLQVPAQLKSEPRRRSLLARIKGN